MKNLPAPAAARFGMVAIQKDLPIRFVSARPAKERPSPRRIGIITGLRLGTIDKREVTLSYSHTQRCKTVKRFKEKWGGKNWYARFVEHIARIVSERLGPPIGTLEDVLNARRASLDGRSSKQGG